MPLLNQLGISESGWEVAADRTLQPVLTSLLPGVRARLELSLVDAGMADAATVLPAGDALTATALIAFMEKLQLSGVKLRMPQGEPPLKWDSLSRKRAYRIAVQVCGENSQPLFDADSDNDLDLIERMDRKQLADIFAACEEFDPLSYNAGSMGDDEKWIGPDSPAQWQRRFKMSETTFRRRIKEGKLRVQKITDKSILIHRDDVNRYEKK